jgi:hypothetical protein
MGERVVSGDFCRYGVRVIVSKILKGEWPLEELFESNRCYCKCGKPHNWLCLTRFHQKTVRFSVDDMATFVKANYTRLKSRRNLLDELRRIRRGATTDHMWAYVMYPLIKDMHEFQRHLKKIADNSGSHAYTKALVTIGAARKPPTIDSRNYDNDMLHYFSLMQPNPQGRRITVSHPFGPYSRKFPSIIWKVCAIEHGLPAELVLLIFNTVYCTNVSSTHFNRVLNLL